MIKAVIFDLDDTLVSENSYQISANRAVLAYLAKITKHPIEAVEEFAIQASKFPRSEYFQQLLPLLGIASNEELVLELISVHRHHLPDISWYSDVLSTLSELRDSGSKLGIITDGYSIAQHQKLNALNAKQHFDGIVVSDDLGRDYWKPHAKPFITIAEMLGVDPAEMIYVGDNPEKDFYISETLGVTTIRIIREDSLKATREYKSGILENYLVHSLNSIVRIFNDLNRDTKNVFN